MQDRSKLQRGQILLIVVLAMVVALTIGLSVATRTVTNTRTSTDEESSERALAAAEAGVEKSLQTNSATSNTFTNNSQFATTLSYPSGLELLLNNDTPVLKDNAVDVWLSTYTQTPFPQYTGQKTGYMTIYWGDAGDICNPSQLLNTKAGIEVIILEGNSVNPTIRHITADPCPGRISVNSFASTSPGGTVKGRSYANRTTLNFTNAILARVIPVYAPTRIGVKGCDGSNGNCQDLPSQGTVVESTGTAGETVRKVETFQSYPSLPIEIFPYVLFAPCTQPVNVNCP